MFLASSSRPGAGPARVHGLGASTPGQSPESIQVRSGARSSSRSPDRGVVRAPHRVPAFPPFRLPQSELLAALVLLLADRARRAEVVERCDLVRRRTLLAGAPKRAATAAVREGEAPQSERPPRPPPRRASGDGAPRRRARAAPPSSRMPHHVRSACVPPQRTSRRKTAPTAPQAMPGRSLSVGATRAADAGRGRGRAGEHRAERRRRRRRGSSPGRSGRGSSLPISQTWCPAASSCGCGERVDRVVAEHAGARRASRRPTSDERPADVPQRLAGAHRAPGRSRARTARARGPAATALSTCSALHARLGRGQLVRRMTVITPASGGSLASAAGRHAELGRRARVTSSRQVERDDAVAGRDPVPGLVLEHVDELLVRDRAGVDPELLDARRAASSTLTAFVAGSRSAPATGAASGLRFGGQPLLERRRDVDVVVELVDQEDRERVLDLRVLRSAARSPASRTALSSICRWTHVVRIETSAISDASDDERPDERAAAFPGLGRAPGVGLLRRCRRTVVRRRCRWLLAHLSHDQPPRQPAQWEQAPCRRCRPQDAHVLTLMRSRRLP